MKDPQEYARMEEAQDSEAACRCLNTILWVAILVLSVGLTVLVSYFCFRPKTSPGSGITKLAPELLKRQHRTCVLIIDPQVDFAKGGSLAVPGAQADAERLAKWIAREQGQIDNITVSLDSHQYLHIGNALFWVGQDGKHPPSFTIITAADVQSGKWKASRPELQDHVVKYTKELEAGAGKLSVCIWPYHCIMGTSGHRIQDELEPALKKWCLDTKQPVEYVYKGQNPLTEMYSVFKAEVVLGTAIYDGAFNQALFDRVASYDRIVVAGQAKSHCVNYSTRDLVNKLPEDKRKNVYLLKDCTSPVGDQPGSDKFAKQADEFEKFLRTNGCHITTTQDLNLAQAAQLA